MLCFGNLIHFFLSMFLTCWLLLACKYSKNFVSSDSTGSLNIELYYVHGRQWCMRTPIKSLSVIWKIFLKPRGTYWWCVVFAPCKMFWPFIPGIHYCRTIFLCIFSGRVELCKEKYVLLSYACINLTLTWLIEYIWYVFTMHCVNRGVCLGFRLH